MSLGAQTFAGGLLSSAAVIADGSITMAKLANLAGLSVIGRGANSTGVPAAITGTDGQVFRVAGTALGFGTIATAGISDNAVTLAKLATQAALTVLANATNGTAVPTAVAAGTDGHVLRRSGTALAFGKVLTSMVTGTATNDSATAGDIGEIITGSAATDSVGSWTTNVAKNITSISLTAGDWDVEGFIVWGGATVGTYVLANISTTTGTILADPVAEGRVDTPFMSQANSYLAQGTGLCRVSLSGTTTVYLVGQEGFTVGTPAVGGRIRARRVR